MSEVEERTICEAFMVVALLCEARNEHPITKYEGCWECTVDERWKLAVNGHADRRQDQEQIDESLHGRQAPETG